MHAWKEWHAHSGLYNTTGNKVDEESRRTVIEALKALVLV